MMDFKTVNLSDLKSYMLESNYDVLRIEKKFPIQKIQETTTQLFKDHTLIEKDGYDHYKAIGLQYGDAQNPLYDAVAQLTYITPEGVVNPKRNLKLIRKINEVGKLYQMLFDYLEMEITLTRARLLLAEAGFKMVKHSDGVSCATLHFPVFTDSKCVLNVNNTPYHLPADGHFYVVNVSKPHWVHNNSTSNRVHITFPITPLSLKRLAWEDLQNFKKFLDTFKINKQLFEALRSSEL